MLSIRFAFSSLVAIAVIGALSLSAACSSGDTVGSSGSSGGGAGTSTSGSSGTSGFSGSGTGSTGTGGTGASGTASGSAGSGTGTTGTGSSGTSGSTADGGEISFSTAIVPIFQSNCGTGGIECHGDPGVTSQPQVRPYLGAQPPATVPTATAMMIWSGLMVSSAEDPSMPLVSPGSDANSFLMHKVDNTLGTLDCSKGDDEGQCGLAMPYTATMLPESTRDTIRAWINGGAPFN
jgi:hypothetical protein